jgi:hypothetical protein
MSSGSTRHTRADPGRKSLTAAEAPYDQAENGARRSKRKHEGEGQHGGTGQLIHW